MLDAAEAILVQNGSEDVFAAEADLDDHFRRLFIDSDALVLAVATRRIASIERSFRLLRGEVGRGSVVENVARCLTETFSPITLRCIALVTRDAAMRRALAAERSRGLPFLAQAREGMARYLTAERAAGRICDSADVTALATSVVGAAYVMFSAPRPPSDLFDVEQAVDSVLFASLVDEETAD